MLHVRFSVGLSLCLLCSLSLSVSVFLYLSVCICLSLAPRPRYPHQDVFCVLHAQYFCCTDACYVCLHVCRLCCNACCMHICLFICLSVSLSLCLSLLRSSSVTLPQSLPFLSLLALARLVQGQRGANQHAHVCRLLSLSFSPIQLSHCRILTSPSYSNRRDPYCRSACCSVCCNVCCSAFCSVRGSISSVSCSLLLPRPSLRSFPPTPHIHIKIIMHHNRSCGIQRHAPPSPGPARRH